MNPQETAEALCVEAMQQYREFLRRGGTKGSRMGHKMRQKVSEAIVAVKRERARAERITPEDEVAVYKDIDVFGK